MARTHTFKGSSEAYGYYAFIEDGELVIGEHWPREGGDTYRGSYAGATKQLEELKREAPKLFNSITKYYEEHKDQAGTGLGESSFKRGKTTGKLKWLKLANHSAAGISMTEYIDSTGTFCKQVWNDGFEEIFEIAK